MKRRAFLILGSQFVLSSCGLNESQDSPANVTPPIENTLRGYMREYARRIFQPCGGLPEAGLVMNSKRIKNDFAENGYAGFVSKVADIADADYADNRINIVDQWILTDIDIEIISRSRIWTDALRSSP